MNKKEVPNGSLQIRRQELNYANYIRQISKNQPLDRIQFAYTPVHGSWLNMAEIQFSVLSRQALNKPFKDKEAVKKVVEQWVQTQNEQKRGAKWQFTNKEARVKLCKLYPTN